MSYKDELVAYDDYRMHILEILGYNNSIIMCGCGTHFWENAFYSEELVSEVKEELKKKDLYNPSCDELIDQVIKDIIQEADPTDGECPGCGASRRESYNDD